MKFFKAFATMFIPTPNAFGASLQSKRGFTLLELIIAVGVFSVASVIIVGSFVFANEKYKNNRLKQEIIGEVRHTFDLISTEVAFGSAFPDSCDSGCTDIQFSTKVRPDMPSKTVQYQLDTVANKIMRAELKTFGACNNSSPFPSICFAPLTSDSTRVDSLEFFVENLEEDRHPLVTIVMNGVAAPGSTNEESFSLSTSVTPRSAQDPGALPPVEIIAPDVKILDPTTNGVTYYTSNTSITLEGWASDNMGVESVIWRNEQTNDTDIAILDAPGASFTNWSAVSVPIMPTVANTILVTASDEALNTGSDTITVVSTAVLGTPILEDVDPKCSSTGKAYLYVDYTSVFGATKYEIYRCDSAADPSCTPTTLDGTATKGHYSDSNIPGLSRRYRVKAVNEISGAVSGFSNILGATALTTCSSGSGSGSGSGSSGSFEITVSKSPIKVSTNGDPNSRSGFSKHTTIKVDPSGSFSSNVTLSISSYGGIAQAYPLWSTTTLTPGEYNKGAKLRIQVQNNTPAGQYKITVKGQSGSESSTVSFWLDVKFAPVESG